MAESINKAKDEQAREYHLTVPLSELNIGKFVASSSAVYMAENVIYYPFDLVRTKLQVQRDVSEFGATWRMIRSLGFRGLFTGFWASTIGSLPSHGVYFVSYNLCKDKLQEIDNNWHKDSHIKGKQALWVSFTAGAAADIIANFFVVPVDVVVSRLQIQETNSEKKYKGSIDAIRTIYKYEGLRGFYRGFGATIITYAPASAIWWTAYEQCKVLFSDYLFLSSQHSESKKVVVEQSVGAQVFAGGIAGILTAVVTNPLDVVKTRLQTQHHHQQIENEVVKTLYKNTWEAFKHIARDEGYRAFAKGIGPRVLTSAFFSSWFGFIYEAVLQFSKK